MNVLQETPISPISYLSKKYKNNRKEKYQSLHRDILSSLAPLLHKWMEDTSCNSGKRYALNPSQKEALFNILKKNCRVFLLCDFYKLKDHSLQHYLDRFYFQLRKMSQKSLFTNKDLQAFLLSSGFFLPSTIYKQIAGFLGIEKHYLLALVSRIRRLVATKMARYFLSSYQSFIEKLLQLKSYQNKSPHNIYSPSIELQLLTQLKQSLKKTLHIVKSYSPRISILHLLKVLGGSAPGLYFGLWKCKIAFYSLFK